MKKHMYLWLVLLVVSALLVAAAGAFLKYDFFPGLELETQEDIISLPFVLLADPQLRYSVTAQLEEAQHLTNTIVPVTRPPEATQPTAPQATEPPATEPPATTPPETTVPPTAPPETEPPYVPVDESWFDDVLFIGESRTQGLKSMGRLGNADYFCMESLTVFGVLSIESSDNNFSKQTLEKLLSKKTYGKIYIHLGINEIGGGKVDHILKQYQNIIDLIRQKQPDAYIIIQAIMSVTEKYTSHARFNLDDIKMLNAGLQELAEQDEHFRFIDVNEWVSDENGYLIAEKSFDGCHLYGTGYAEWAQWLLENAGWLGIP